MEEDATVKDTLETEPHKVFVGIHAAFANERSRLTQYAVGFLRISIHKLRWVKIEGDPNRAALIADTGAGAFQVGAVEMQLTRTAVAIHSKHEFTRRPELDHLFHTGDFRADDRENQQTMNTASSPTPSPLHTQVGGSHYRDMAIQPAEYCHANKIGKLEGDVIAYVSRHRSKNGREDIEKAIHTLELIKALEYQEPYPCTAAAPEAQPEPAAVHNPDRLTPEQVGTADGWRLLDEDEVIESSNRAIKGVEIWCRSDASWYCEILRANYKGGTYRTKLTREELAAARGLAQPVSAQVDQCDEPLKTSPADPLVALASSIFPALRQLIREEIERAKAPQPTTTPADRQHL